MIEKAVDTKAKVSLQPSSRSREIDFRYPKSYRPSAKKDKNEATQEHWDADKAKSYNLFPAANTSQSQTQAFKKDKSYGSCQGGHSTTGVNATKVAKKNKDNAKELSHIKCYTCKQKGYYANKYPKKSKN